MIEIDLTQGKKTFIDDADKSLVENHKWHASRNRHTWYARTVIRDAEHKRTWIYMHRLIANNCPAGIEVDHADGNGLNNRRSNLRLATKAQNRANCRIPSTNTSGAKGVHFQKKAQKWQALIRSNGSRIHLGYFADKSKAIQAYNNASKRYHREFSRTKNQKK